MARPTPLKRAIFESGLTQRAIAAEIGLGEAALSRIVHGLHAPDATWQKLARVLGRGIHEIRPGDSESEERAA